MISSRLANPTSAVQKAMVAILRGDATLDALLARVKGLTPPVPAVVDGAAEGQPYPYVVLGDALSIPSNDLTGYGREVTETLHVWTSERSFAKGQTIADRIAALLDHRTATVSAALVAYGHRCVRVELEFDQAIRDPDPQLRHHILRFRFETEQLT